MSNSDQPRSSGARAVVPPDARDLPPALVRTKRRVALLVLVLVASLGLPHFTALPRSAVTGEIAWGSLAATVGGCLFVLAAAWLAIRHAIEPELRAFARERVEREARQATALERAQATNQYLRDVSHELRASMNAVLGLTQLLGRSPLDANQHRQVRTIDGAARALLRIMNDLLALSGPEPHSFDVVPMGCSLHELLRIAHDVVEPSATDRGVALDLRIALELPDRVVTDAGRVQQIVLGLFRYAIETSEPGLLRIDARAKTVGDQRFELALTLAAPRSPSEAARTRSEPARSPSEPARTRSDSASPPSEAARSPSDTTRPPSGAAGAASEAGRQAAARDGGEPGAALDTAPPASLAGLALAQRLSALMGGGIRRGASGALELALPMSRIDPIVIEEAAPPRTSPIPLSIRLPPTRSPILLVEPNPSDQVEALELLEGLGFEVEAVTDPARAVERVARDKYAAVLLSTEVGQPEGREGVSAAEALRVEIGAGRPAIIGCTREPLATARERPGARHFETFIAKPLERQSLSVVLAQWLEGEVNPASSGLRLSKLGALDQATRRGLAVRISSAPASSLPDLEPGRRTERALELFALEAPGQLVALARAASRGRRDEVVTLAERLKERCFNCGAMKMAALCRTLEGARDLSLEQLGANVKALGKALEAVLALLGEAAPALESTPAAASSDRTPDPP